MSAAARGNGRLDLPGGEQRRLRRRPSSHQSARPSTTLRGDKAVTSFEPPEASARAGTSNRRARRTIRASTALPDGSSLPARSQATRHGAVGAPLAGHQQPACSPARNPARHDPARLASAATSSDSVSGAARCAGWLTSRNAAIVSHHALRRHGPSSSTSRGKRCCPTRP